MISSFLLQDIPRHPDTRLFEVREAFKRSLLLGFQGHIRATDAEPLINALLAVTHQAIILFILLALNDGLCINRYTAKKNRPR